MADAPSIDDILASVPDRQPAGASSLDDIIASVPEKRSDGALSRLGDAFSLGDAMAVTQGREFTRDLGASLEESWIGRARDAARSALGLEVGPTAAERAQAIRDQDLSQDQIYAGAKQTRRDLALIGFQPMSYKDVNGLGSFLQFVGENIAVSAPQMLTGIASGGFQPVVSVIQLGGEANEELKKRTDLTEGQRVAVATGAGLVMSALDMVGRNTVFKGLGAGRVATEALDGALVDTLIKRGLPRKLATTFEAAIVEGSTEALQEAVKMGATWASGGEYTGEEVIDSLLQSLTAGAAAGGGISFAMPGGGRKGDPKADTTPGTTDPSTNTNPTTEAIPVTGPAQDQSAALSTTNIPAVNGRTPAPTMAPDEQLALARDKLASMRAGQTAAVPAEPAPAETSQAAAALEALNQPAAAPAVPAAPAAAEPSQAAAALETLNQPSAPVAPEGNAAPAAQPDAAPSIDDIIAQTPAVGEQPAAPVDGAEAAGDTAPTVPEAPATLIQQGKDLVDRGNKRKAVYIPRETLATIGEDEVPMGKNVYSVRLPNGGMLFWNVSKIMLGKKDVLGLYKDGNLGQILGLGPFTKSDVAESVARGNSEQTIVERTPDGTPVKEVASTPELQDQQMAALEGEKGEGNTLTIEPVGQVLKGRKAARGRKAAQPAPAPAPETNEAPTGPQRSETDTERRIPINAANGTKWVTEQGGRVETGEDGFTYAVFPKKVIDSATAKFNGEEAAKPEVAKKAKTQADKKANALVAAEQASERRVAANRGEISNPEDEARARIPATVKWGAKTIEARVQMNVRAAGIFERFGPRSENAGDLSDIPALKVRLTGALEAAKTANISLGTEVSDITANYVAWLIQVRQALKDVTALENAKTQNARGAYITKIFDFISAEIVLHETGSSEELRGIRKEASSQIKEARESVSSKDGDESDPLDNLADESLKPIEDQLDGDENEDETSNGPTELEPEPTPEFADGDRVMFLVGDESLPGTIVGEKKERGDRTFYRIKFDEGGTEEVAVNGYNLFKMQKPKAVTSEGNDVLPLGKTGARRAASDIDPTALEDADVRTLDEFGDLFDRQSTVDAVLKSPLFSKLQRAVQLKLARLLFDKLVTVAGDARVVVVTDEDFAMLAQAGEKAYYDKQRDLIVIPDSVASDRARLAYYLMHEAAHAAFVHVMDSDSKIAAQVEELRAAALDHAKRNGLDTGQYGLRNSDEFVAEMWSNPQFQEFLAQIPLSKDVGRRLIANGWQRVVASSLKTVWDAVRATVSEAFGVRELFAKAGLNPQAITAFDVMLDISDKMLFVAEQARARSLGSDQGTILAAGNPMVERFTKAGLKPDVAQAMTDMIEQDFGGTVTDEEFDALVAMFSVPNAGQVTQSGNQPPWGPRITKVLGGGSRKWRGGTVGRLLLSMMSLDGISRKARFAFEDAQGNAMVDYEDYALMHDKVRQDVEEKHYQDFADFEDLKRTDPAGVVLMQEIVAELAPIDVNLGQNAKNDHLKGNARKNLQAKQRLPKLQKMFADLEANHPEAAALMMRMAGNYRDSFNEHIEWVTRNLLMSLEKPLPKSTLNRIVQNVIDGKMTQQDETDIGNPEIANVLRKSENLRKRKGLYFPSVRFGEWVVQTTTAIKDPGITSVLTKSGRQQVKIKTEIKDGTVHFIFDDSIRGSKAAVTKAVYDWVAKNDLPLASYVARYRDRKTGKIVSKGDMVVGQDYDAVHVVSLQNEGVHFFETRKEADAFFEQAKKDKAAGILTDVKGVMDKNVEQTDRLVGGNKSSMDAIKRVLERNGALSAQDRGRIEAAVRDAIVTQMAGNRYEKRLLGRKDVLGQSNELGRAAAFYGRSVGNAIASSRSGDGRRKSLERMQALKSGTNDEHNELRSQVVNELVKREELDGQPLNNSVILNDLMTINTIDKLASPANLLLNATQVMLSTAPVLGGRFGNAKTAKALKAAYARTGALQTLKGGLANTKKAVTSWGKTHIDPENVVGSIRSNLGSKYDQLFSTLVAEGDIAEGVGIENAEQFSANRGTWGKTLAKTDRIFRQMTNAIEAINRSVTAVASYDLALESGMTPEQAIQFAKDTLRRTQFRYDPVNAPRMIRQNRAFRFFFTFKKFGFGQYQLLGEMVDQAFNGATKEEKRIAGKQILNMLAVQAATAGSLSLPGTEIFKAVVMIGAILGLTDGWDEWEAKIKAIYEDALGKDLGDVLSRGLVSKLLGVDLSSRLSWQDLITGMPPTGADKDSMVKWFGQALLGAPGGTAVDFVTGVKKMGEAAAEADPKKFNDALALLVPVKVVSDSIKAMEGVRSGKMNGFDAAKQVVGFRSLRQADIGDKIGENVRSSRSRKADESALISAYINALTRADIARATAKIRAYNASLPEGKREISIRGLEKLRRENQTRYAN